MNARDLMETGVETVAPDDEISDVLGRLARAQFSGFPVVDENDKLVGVVTEHDLLSLFDPDDRILWIPVGLPPFTETLTYGIDVPWDELDLGADVVENARKPVRKIMTTDVTAVGSRRRLGSTAGVADRRRRGHQPTTGRRGGRHARRNRHPSGPARRDS